MMWGKGYRWDLSEMETRKRAKVHSNQEHKHGQRAKSVKGNG